MTKNMNIGIYIVEEISIMHTFYATFGSGQPNFPGYLEVEVQEGDKEKAETIARKRVQRATDGRWSMMYNSLDEVHEMDRVFRGKV